VPPHLPPVPEGGRIIVVGAGKAAAAMARATERHYVGNGQKDLIAGFVTTRHGYGLPTDAIEVIEAGHPVPDANSIASAKRALELAASAGPHDLVLALMSGGASALWSAPVAGVSFEAKQTLTRQLLRSGARISEMNCVRKHLSRIKGGRLAAAAGTTVTLALSDVHAPIADDPSVIGSGPTVADPSTFADAAAIVEKFRVELPAAVRDHLAAGLRGAADETVKADDARIESSSYAVVGNRQTAVEGARRAALASGYEVIVIDEVIAGEASRSGEAFASRALRDASGRRRPVCVIGSGETTVTVRGGGSGGRNQEFVLGSLAALQAQPAEGVVVGSAGTDGIDGPTTAAGALVDETTIERARALGLSPRAALEQNDAFPFFAALQDLILWGPTGTNVGDLHVVLLG
jgi:glycerate 2-kinase